MVGLGLLCGASPARGTRLLKERALGSSPDLHARMVAWALQAGRGGCRESHLPAQSPPKPFSQAPRERCLLVAGRGYQAEAGPEEVPGMKSQRPAFQWRQKGQNPDALENMFTLKNKSF